MGNVAKVTGGTDFGVITSISTVSSFLFTPLAKKSYCPSMILRKIRNILKLLMFGALVFGCTNIQDEEEATHGEQIVEDEVANVSELLVRLLRKEDSDPVNSFKYELEDNLVQSVEYTNFDNPEHTATTTFEYDENGRLTRAAQTGETSVSVSWEGQVASLSNSEGTLFASFEYEEGKIINYTQHASVGNSITQFNYDENGNIASKESPPGALVVEYLDYNTAKTNPLYLTRSIAMFNMSSRGHFKNIFGIERVQPIEGDDFSIGLTDYQYVYTFDAEGRVSTVEDEKSLIYTTQFEYQ